MGDIEYEKEYMERKKRLRKLHKRLKDTKHTQEIYHKIMGSDGKHTLNDVVTEKDKVSD